MLEQQNLEQKNTEQQNIEQHNIEQQNIKQQNLEQKNTEQQNIEQQNIEQQNLDWQYQSLHILVPSNSKSGLSFSGNSKQYKYHAQNEINIPAWGWGGGRA